ncbi:MAG: hypothetical protein GF411_00410 [Candidatus Lokiarchaeota archaeon]|nr:hypothetical protein [Candidatus Lokiarchaeota archaeon]
MSEEKPKKKREIDLPDMIDIGSIFRNSGTITFVVEIVSVIVMLGAIAAYFSGAALENLNEDLRILLILVFIVVTIVVFLAAFSVFVRFSRRISDFVIGPGIQEVRMDTPRVKFVVYLYGFLIAVVAIIGIYTWYLVDKYALIPWAGDSLSLRVFGFALGAFFIAFLMQLIVALVGRTATKVILEVLDADDSDFLEE